MVVDWHSFNIRANEAVNFNQPNANAIALNRVTGTESSSILGSLTANGKVFVLNPNGVLFGAGAQVNVGGLVASTLNLSNANFMAGNFNFTSGNFTGNGAGSIVNNGNIHISNGGTLALIAPVVKNTGTLNADQGKVLLASADDVTLTMLDGNMVSYTLNKGSVQSLIDNGGLIQADGGQVVLTAKGQDALSQSAINHTGIIEAQTIGSKNGKIELLGDMQIGELNVNGKLDASAPNNTVRPEPVEGQAGEGLGVRETTKANGGFIETSAAKVNIAENTQVTTLAANGENGTWLIDPLDITINSGMARTISTALGSGNVIINSAGNNMPDTTSVETAGNGDIFVNSAINWSVDTRFLLIAGRNVNINAPVSGTGNHSGLSINPLNGTYYLNNGGKINLPGANAEFSVKGTPYTLIHDVNQLQAMNNNLTGNYALGGDIDASATSGWNSGAGFLQVGYQNTPFSGTLDGLGHAVSNLYINRPDDIEVGLIGTLTQGAVRNVSVADVSVTGHNSVGGLIGAMRWGSTLRNAYSTGIVKGTGQVLSNGQVEGAGGIGGLVGGATPYISYPSNGYSYCVDCISIDSSASSATVYGNSSVGGLIGFTDQIRIRSSYAAGSVNGFTIGNQTSSYIGGLVGHYFNSQELSHSYSSSDVRSTGSTAIGGLVGADSSGTIGQSYFDSQKAGAWSNTGGTGLTTAQMQHSVNFTDWDFTNTWRIVEGSSYPLLRALTQGTIVVTPDQLGIKANDVSKVYDGVAVTKVTDGATNDHIANDLASLTGWNGGVTATGLLGTDALTDTSIFNGTLSYGGTWQGAKNADHYTIIPSGLSSQKYEIIYSDGNLSITPRPLDISVSKVYDGKTTFDTDFKVESGKVAGDTVNVSGVITAASKNVGQYSNQAISGSEIVNGATFLTLDNANYATTGIISGRIERRPLTVRVLNTFRGVGEANPTKATAITYGLVAGETLADLNVYADPAATSTAASGNEYALNPVSSVVFTNGEASNYDISYKPGTLSITANDFKGKDWWKNGITEEERSRLLGYKIQLDSVANEISLASAVYDFSTPDGFKLIDQTDFDPTGFAAATYKNTASGKYFVVFRGSENPKNPHNLSTDWVNNVAHVIQVPFQYTEGLDYARKQMVAYGGINNVSLVGHSLGGGIAMYSAAMTGMDAVTFNPAKLWGASTAASINFAANDVPIGAVTNYVFDNELVQWFSSDSGYYGGFKKINLFTEGTINDHFLTHVNLVKVTINDILAKNISGLGQQVQTPDSLYDSAISVVSGVLEKPSVATTGKVIDVIGEIHDAGGLGSSARVARANAILGGAGTALQAAGSVVLVANLFEDAKDGQLSKGSWIDLGINVAGYSPASLLTAPFEIAALATTLTGNGSLSDGLRSDLENANSQLGGFFESLNLISTQLANGILTQAEAEIKFNNEVAFRKGLLKDIRNSYRDWGLALTLVATGNASATDKVIAAVNQAMTGLDEISFSQVQMVAAAKVMSNGSYSQVAGQ